MALVPVFYNPISKPEFAESTGVTILGFGTDQDISASDVTTRYSPYWTYSMRANDYLMTNPQTASTWRSTGSTYDPINKQANCEIIGRCMFGLPPVSGHNHSYIGGVMYGSARDAQYGYAAWVTGRVASGPVSQADLVLHIGNYNGVSSWGSYDLGIASGDWGTSLPYIALRVVNGEDLKAMAWFGDVVDDRPTEWQLEVTPSISYSTGYSGVFMSSYKHSGSGSQAYHLLKSFKVDYNEAA